MIVNPITECRALSVPRPLAPWEARSVAERQAYRFHALMNITEPPFPEQAIEYLPRVEVRYVASRRLSGAISWRQGKWRVLVNRTETWGRQRYSLSHELKHLIDHPLRTTIYQDSRFGSAEYAAEKAADYFAACLLMPKAWMRRCFYDEGFRDPRALAQRFQVSTAAMLWRFDQLGLLEPEAVR
ncbi:MAG: ImmA/IrrE family metallo-endopeptidase [Solirubrobacterales bacterium]